MLLQRHPWTAGDKRLMTVSYDAFLPLGGSLVTAAVTAAVPGVISGVAIVASGRKVQFFLAGAIANTTLTVTVQVTDNVGQVVTDTIDFVVTDP